MTAAPAKPARPPGRRRKRRLGGFRKATARTLTVRYPDGTVKRVAKVATNAIVTVRS